MDTAKIEEIRKVKEWGILDGVTTNPTLLSQTGKPWKEAALEILREIPDKPVSLEVIATDAEGMIKEARELAKMGPNVVIKIPFTTEGLKAIRVLTEEGIKTNVTLVFLLFRLLLLENLELPMCHPSLEESMILAMTECLSQKKLFISMRFMELKQKLLQPA